MVPSVIVSVALRLPVAAPAYDPPPQPIIPPALLPAAELPPNPPPLLVNDELNPDIELAEPFPGRVP
jgi:hypothetical protein